MFVVISVNATDAETNAVKSYILEEGIQPHVSPGAERTVSALVG